MNRRPFFAALGAAAVSAAVAGCATPSHSASVASDESFPSLDSLSSFINQTERFLSGADRESDDVPIAIVPAEWNEAEAVEYLQGFADGYRSRVDNIAIASTSLFGDDSQAYEAGRSAAERLHEDAILRRLTKPLDDPEGYAAEQFGPPMRVTEGEAYKDVMASRSEPLFESGEQQEQYRSGFVAGYVEVANSRAMGLPAVESPAGNDMNVSEGRQQGRLNAARTRVLNHLIRTARQSD